jgi:esterase/lipase superfamily enzyme
MIKQLAAWLVFGTTVIVAGCASNKPYSINLMPAPGIYAEAAYDPFPRDLPIGEFQPGVFYATGREPAREGSAERFYENERAHMLRLGVARVALARQGITWDEARRISLAKSRTGKYPLRVASVEEYGILKESITPFHELEIQEAASDRPGEQFARDINAVLARSDAKDIYVYVHGYKVNFENPILVATELWHFLGYEGVFTAFSWPSTPSMWAYMRDAESAAYATRNLVHFIELLARETDAERIHILGYSAGTRLVLDTLDGLSLVYLARPADQPRRDLRLGNVILVGSDVDRDIFAAMLARGLLRMQDRLTIYLSERDEALGFSTFIFGRNRLGQFLGAENVRPAAVRFLREHDDLVVVNVTGAEKSGVGGGHSYFRQSPWASSDILMTLRYDLDPEQRGLVTTDEVPIWEFPPDYLERLRASLARIDPAGPRAPALATTP